MTLWQQLKHDVEYVDWGSEVCFFIATPYLNLATFTMLDIEFASLTCLNSLKFIRIAYEKLITCTSFSWRVIMYENFS